MATKNRMSAQDKKQMAKQKRHFCPNCNEPAKPIVYAKGWKLRFRCNNNHTHHKKEMTLG